MGRNEDEIHFRITYSSWAQAQIQQIGVISMFSPLLSPRRVETKLSFAPAFKFEVLPLKKILA